MEKRNIEKNFRIHEDWGITDGLDPTYIDPVDPGTDPFGDGPDLFIVQ